MSIDIIGNFLTIIRNGTMVAKPSVVARHSKMVEAIARILKEEGYIKDFVTEKIDDNKRSLRIYLKYHAGESVIHEITRKSSPGGRYYVAADAIKPVIDNLGISILTTSMGVISHKKAKLHGVGGEVLCTVW